MTVKLSDFFVGQILTYGGERSMVVEKIDNANGFEDEIRVKCCESLIEVCDDLKGDGLLSKERLLASIQGKCMRPFVSDNEIERDVSALTDDEIEIKDLLNSTPAKEIGFRTGLLLDFAGKRSMVISVDERCGLVRHATIGSLLHWYSVTGQKKEIDYERFKNHITGIACKSVKHDSRFKELGAILLTPEERMIRKFIHGLADHEWKSKGFKVGDVVTEGTKRYLVIEVDPMGIGDDFRIIPISQAGNVWRNNFPNISDDDISKADLMRALSGECMRDKMSDYKLSKCQAVSGFPKNIREVLTREGHRHDQPKTKKREFKIGEWVCLPSGLRCCVLEIKGEQLRLIGPRTMRDHLEPYKDEFGHCDDKHLEAFYKACWRSSDWTDVDKVNHWPSTQDEGAYAFGTYLNKEPSDGDKNAMRGALKGALAYKIHYREINTDEPEIGIDQQVGRSIRGGKRIAPPIKFDFNPVLDTDFVQQMFTMPKLKHTQINIDLSKSMSKQTEGNDMSTIEEKTLYATTKEKKQRYGTFLIKNTQGQIVLEMKGEGGNVEAFDEDAIEEVIPFTVEIEGQHGSIHFEVAKSKLKVDDYVMCPSFGPNIYRVSAVDTKHKGARKFEGAKLNTTKIA